MSAFPADELLPEFRRELSFRDGGLQLSQGEQRTAERAVLPIQMGRAFHLLMRVELGIEAAGNSEPWAELIGRFVAEQRIIQRVTAIVRRGFGIQGQAGFDVSALGEVLGTQGADERECGKGENPSHDGGLPT